MTLTEGVTLQVDDVYVPLGLVERKKPSKRKDQDDISPEQGSELYKETEITKTFEHDAFLEEVIKQKNTPKSKGKRIAIIGEPGAGKTTLLQQIADWVYRKIPQSVLIWVSLADLRRKELKAYLLETWLTQVAEKIGKAEATQQLKNDFVALFNQKNVWLLLDGLDEMSAFNPLTEISRQLRESGLISQARIVLTCRVNLWDGSINALDDFDIYRTLDFFYPEKVEEFIDKFFNKIERSETGKQLCNALKEPGKERIQDLVKNPLRLTLLCLNWLSGDGKLPDTQAGLYQRFVDDFYKWKKEKFATNFHQPQQLNIKLGELAKAAIDKEATRFRLHQDFVSQFLGDAEDDNSLFKLALKRGWLNQVGIDANRKPVYAFFHASFQEYFAATAIDDWRFFLNHIPKNPSKGTYHIFEPQWKQVILLWLGREDVSEQEKEAFIKALVEFNDRCTGFYGLQAYFLAAVGIAEFESRELSDKIIEQLIEWTFGSVNFLKHQFHLSSLIAKIAKNLLLQTHYKKVVYALIKRLKSREFQGSHLDTALILLEKSPGHELAVKIIVDYLDTSPVIFKHSRAINLNRIQVISKLEKFAASNPLAIATLAKLHENKHNKEQTISRLDFSWLIPKIYANNIDKFLDLIEKIDINNIEKAIKGLNDLNILIVFLGRNINLKTKIDELAIIDDLIDISHRIDDSESEFISGYFSSINLFAMNRLAELASTNSDTITNLIERLHKNNDKYIRQQLMMSLGKAACININATKAVVQILQTTEDTIIAEAAIYFLKSVSNSSLLTVVVTGLKDYIEDTEVYEIIWHCSQNMPYPDFYQAWHQHNFATRAMRSLKKIFSTRII